MQDSAPYYPPVTQPTVSIPTSPVTPTPTTNWYQNKKMLLIAGGVCLALLLLLRSPLFHQPRIVSATGKASVTFVPAKSIVTVLYTNSGSNQDTLNTESIQEFDSLKQELSSLGATELAAINSQIEFESGNYKYSRGLRFTLTDMNALPQVTSLLQAKNATIVQSLYFPEDENKVNKELMSKALKDARDKAGASARAANGWVGKVISVTEGPNNTAGGSVVMISNLAESADEQSSTSSMEVAELTTTVNVTFALTSLPFSF